MPIDISIHALLAESDFYRVGLGARVSHFYPRSPCGERRHGFHLFPWHFFISIHALLAESDPRKNLVNGIRLVFLSTLSLRRATTELFAACTAIASISIHALLAESDPGKVSSVLPGLAFLSTLSLRRATDGLYFLCAKKRIFLSTLSLRRATGFPLMTAVFLRYFYPRSPCGERHYYL